MISSNLPVSALRGISGSEIIALVMPHMSADPSINALSASWGVLMRPATKTGLSETSLMACESGNVYPGSKRIEGTICVDPFNPAEVPAVILM